MVTGKSHRAGINKKAPLIYNEAFRIVYRNLNYNFADFTVLIITAATLYGSAAELGRRSSR